MTLLFFDSAPEIIFILVVALIIFGPRKLPELSRSLGKSLGEFKRASDEFKRTWEREVSLETVERERKIGEAMLPPEDARSIKPAEGNMISSSVVAANADDSAHAIARGTDGSTQEGESYAQTFDRTTANADESATVEPAPQSPHKTDWL
jgi:TatA/E family protein of Tat protein translocase